MRYICFPILILINIAYIVAETTPLPRIMHIFMKDGTTDSMYCSMLDPLNSVQFSDNGSKMKVGLIDQSVRWYSTSMIDSITFKLVSPPVEEIPAEIPAEVPIEAPAAIAP